MFLEKLILGLSGTKFYPSKPAGMNSGLAGLNQP
jgi:hypothetical protein